MAKASKVVATVKHTFDNDSAIVARDFATFGKWTFNSEARDAIVRRCADKVTFNKIRIAALASWLEADRGYDAASALANVDGTLVNPAAFGKGAKRTTDNQKDYKDASNAWNYYLACSHIETFNTRAKGGKRKPRVAGVTPPQAPNADAPQAKAPPASLSAVVPVKGDMLVTIEQFANCSALMGRIANTNAKALQGDKGAALRALASHVAAEMKRIAAMG